eukprot:4817673-Alexandrium_andersonii.AAC.1
MEESTERRQVEASSPPASMRADGHAPGMERPASGPERMREGAEVGLDEQSSPLGGVGCECSHEAPPSSAERRAGVL